MKFQKSLSTTSPSRLSSPEIMNKDALGIEVNK